MHTIVRDKHACSVTCVVTGTTIVIKRINSLQSSKGKLRYLYSGLLLIVFDLYFFKFRLLIVSYPIRGYAQ